MNQGNYQSIEQNLETEIKNLGFQLVLNGIRTESDWPQRSQWITNRVEARYPTPGYLPPQPPESPIEPMLMLMFAAVLVLPSTAAIGMSYGSLDENYWLLILVVVFWAVYFSVWIASGVWSSWHKIAEAAYWQKNDPYRVQRKRLRSMIDDRLKRFFIYDVGEITRPVSSVPVPELTAYPRLDLVWEPLGPRPELRGTCNPRDAEYLAMTWMQYLGATGCEVSPATRDGGADVVSDNFVAEVKHHAVAVSPAYVRQIFGVATADRKRALFFSLSGYSEAAKEFGEKAGVALFVYDFQNGTLRAVTSRGQQALREGLLAIA